LVGVSEVLFLGEELAGWAEVFFGDDKGEEAGFALRGESAELAA
jgi:hypothetical protein